MVCIWSLGLAVLGASFWLTRKEKNKEDHQGFVANENVEASGEQEMTPGAVPLMLAIGEDLIEENLNKSLQTLRWKMFEKLGLPLPEIQMQVLRNGRQDEFELLLYQEPIIKLNLTKQNVLTLKGIDGVDSEQNKLAFNQQILHWHPVEALETIQLSGQEYYQGNDIAIRLVEMAAQHYAKEFLGVQETRYLMDSMEMRYAELVKELQRLLPVSKVTEILQRLVEENISIRDLRTIFETLVEWASKEKDTIMLTEYVRVALRRHIRRKFTVEEGWIRCC